jgi:DHA1 family chloramphenicol resistance protein-like MFS transporter
MPFAVYVLGLAVFAQGTSEFMLSGLISGIAEDLNVSIPDAGLLTSAFAFGMVVGAPLMALLGRNWPRRRGLLLFLGIFIAVHVLGALTPDYELLLATRVVAAVANAGFWAVAVVTAREMVAPGLKDRATSVVIGGVTIACVAGVPAGALLGEAWGWRSAFWAVAAVSVPAALAIVLTVPGRRAPAGNGTTTGQTTTGQTATGLEPQHSTRARTELRALAEPRLLLTLLTMALMQAATFGAFAYFEPLITRVTGLGAGWVPVALALFGVGSFIGIAICGRIVDTRPGALITFGMLAQLLGWVLFALTAGNPAAAITLALLQGALAFSTGPALISRVYHLAPNAPNLAGAFATCAFNLGAVLGPWAGGLALSATHTYRAPLWMAALLMILAWIAYGTRLRLGRRPARGARNCAGDQTSTVTRPKPSLQEGCEELRG